MTSTFQRALVGTALVAAFALGGAGVASALSSDGGSEIAPAVADAATGADEPSAAETPSADATPADREDCPEHAGAPPERGGQEGTTSEDADV